MLVSRCTLQFLLQSIPSLFAIRNCVADELFGCANRHTRADHLQILGSLILKLVDAGVQSSLKLDYHQRESSCSLQLIKMNTYRNTEQSDDPLALAWDQHPAQ
jgi:hypothetical protein